MPETFGKTDKGASPADAGADYIQIFKFTSGSAGTLKSISLYVEYKGTAKVKCAIYDSSLHLVANGTTEEKDVSLGQDDWMEFNFSTPPTVLASTVYWLGFWNSDVIRAFYDDGEVDQRGYKAEAYDTWPDPISPDGYLAYVYSIFATYEEAPPPAKKTLVQAALISIAPLIVLPTLAEILKFTGG